jgi:hypothetical protein
MPDGPCAGLPNHRRVYRDWRRLSGLGCFGKPATLITMLVNVMAQYARRTAQADDCLVHASAVARAVRHLMRRLSEERRVFDGLPPSKAIQVERVAGFFIHSDCTCTRIRIFTRKTACHPFDPADHRE